jgi:cysteinyl-tRNA synthetase
MHGQHLQLHVPLLQQFMQSINEGQADPQQVLPALQALYQHISETAQYAAGDPALQAVVSNAKQILQYAEEAINNTMKALEKIQREQQQISEEGGGQPQASEVDMKLQKAQVDMQITQQKAELEMAIKQKKFDQEQAIRDAEAALKFREQE